MPERLYSHIILGGGLTGAAAVEGIRQHDAKGPILLISAEPDLPYDRPPLTKQLWTGKKKVEQIFVQPQSFYTDHGVDLKLSTEVTELNVTSHTVRDSAGNPYRYNKLLLATGGTPRRLAIPGGDLKGISYYRTLRDYQQLRAAVTPGKSAVVIGGGFIGSEIAASLNINQVAVTIIFPQQWLVSRIFPEPLGRSLTDYYRSKGVTVFSEDTSTSIQQNGDAYLIQTRAGHQIRADIVIAGIGITPNIALAQAAGLKT
jgi:3-phenylpropionate/trans-cinnamate dioxygenase ferredoxin reductase subunit